MTKLVYFLILETLKQFKMEHFISLIYGMILTASGENLTACAKGKGQMSCAVTVGICAFSYYIDGTTPLHP